MCLLSLHTEPYLTLALDCDNKWLYADWQAVQTPQTVEAGCQLILRYTQEEKCCKLLNDSTSVQGTWSVVTEWVNNGYFDKLAMVGVRKLAWVHSENCFSRYTTDYVLQQVSNPVAAAFNDLPGAYIWLQQSQIASYLRAS
ncbi:hypothetical protein [Hymenobacter sp. GOD-10R]|uniref:hypothetical protein n=1 Tax=Hymenobacter sp. GOD-10R TaxID=3093922 RepID=UPI002D7836D7|nr:hypothetical protein [Hymenobacter sp. GOD-10R]WRQ29199.1 hypothetical protein SD425_02845 [Hymenobacter sp. GOD-10R]